MVSLRSSELILPSSNTEAMRLAFVQQAAILFRAEGSTYPNPSGMPELLKAIVEMTPHWQGEVLITNSATEGTYLALKTAAEAKGRKLAVQVPCYFGVLRQAKDLHMEIIPWETVEDLEKIPKFDVVLLTSNFTPPRGQSLSDADKQRLAEIAKRQSAFVIEDNPYDPMWFEEQPAAIPSDPARTIRIGSLSKITSPEFRLGFLRADDALLKTLRSQKITINLSSPSPLQPVALAGLGKENLEALRTEFKGRAALLQKEIATQLGIEVSMPQGGNFICLPFNDDIDVHDFVGRCEKAGLNLDFNDHHYPDRQIRPYVRLHYGAITQQDIAGAVGIIHRTLMEMQGARLTFDNMKGKHILVTSGAPKEVIDGVRHYANHARPEDHGHRVAAALAKQGAIVTLVTAKTKVAAPESVTVVSRTPNNRMIISAQDLMETCTSVLTSQKFAAIVPLASVASLKPVNSFEHKLKVKINSGDPVIMEVMANIDMLTEMEQANPLTAFAGYNSKQEFLTKGLPLQDWRTFIESQLHNSRIVVGAPRSPDAQPQQDLAGKKIVVSSGPVAETLTTYGDVITNFSSGLQGHEIACALVDRGADVVLVSGPVILPDPVHPNIRTTHVCTAIDMLDACMRELPIDVYVGVAAVADFRAENPINLNLMPGEPARISLVQNPDILWTMGKHETLRPDVVIGFAAETKDLEVYAQGKLEKKGADAIFANLVGRQAMTRSSNRNYVYRVTRDGVCDCGETDKYQVGLTIADFIVNRSAKTPAPSIRDASEDAAPT